MSEPEDRIRHKAELVALTSCAVLIVGSVFLAYRVSELAFDGNISCRVIVSLCTARVVVSHVLKVVGFGLELVRKRLETES